MAADWLQTEEAFSRWLLVSDGASPDTARTYKYRVRQFAYRLVGTKCPIRDASHDDVEAFVADLLTRQSRATVANTVMALRAFYRYCHHRSLRHDDPTHGIHIKRGKRVPRAPFTAPEINRLVAAATSDRDRALIMLLASTGLRISEALSLDASGIDWKRGEALIKGKRDKDRVLALGEGMLRALESLRGPDGRFWRSQSRSNAGEPWSRKAALLMLWKVADRAGVPRAYLHRFRITFANDFLSHGGDLGALQEIMGHADISMTAHYAGFSRRQRALDQMRRFSSQLPGF